MNGLMRNALVWGVIIFMLFALFNMFQGGAGRQPEISYSDFLTAVENSQVSQGRNQWAGYHGYHDQW